jgi:ATP-binding cassette subfamily B protein
MSAPLADTEQIQGKAYDLQLIRRFWPYLRPHRKWLFASFAIAPLMIGAELLQPVLLKHAFDSNIASDDMAGLRTTALALLACIIAQTALGFVQLYTQQVAGQRAAHGLRLAVHRHVLGQSAGFFDHTPIGRLTQRMTGDTDNIQEMFAAGGVNVIVDLSKLIAIFFLLFRLDAGLALMVLAAMPVLMVVVDGFRRWMRTAFRAIRAKLAELNAYAQEQLGGVKITQAFAREGQAQTSFERINGEHRDSYFSSLKADATLFAVVEGLGVLALAVVLWRGSGALATGALTFGTLVAFTDLLNRFFIPVRDFSSKYAVMQSSMASAERIFRLLDRPEPDAPVTSQPAPSEDGQLAASFRGVRFGYRPGEPVLTGVDLEVKKGETVAVVGTTGSGKSTLIKLLVRLYEADAGVIRVDGQDVRSLPASELRRRVTVIPQDVFLFAGTIGDNLRAAAPGVPDDELRAALDRVGVTPLLLARGPDPLALPVGERGAGFSAGERQLIAFARALARRPELLVLDEATASIDPEAEALIDRGLAEVTRGRTCLLVAHRLATVQKANRIVVMHAGQVAEQGTHAELLALGGRYARLWQLHEGREGRESRTTPG